MVMLPDPMLDPEKYPDNNVLWVETERKEKIWPYSSKLWKHVIPRAGTGRLDPTPEHSAHPWHRQFGETKNAKPVQ